MLTFTYTVTINMLPIDDDKKPIETLTGITQAESHAQAKKQVQSLAFDRCRQLERERGGIYGYENVQVAVVQDVATTPPLMYADFMQAYKEGKTLPASQRILITVRELVQHEHDLLEEVFEQVQAEIHAFWQKREGE